MGQQSAWQQQRKAYVFKFLHNPNTKWSHVYHSLVATVFCTYAIMVTFYQTFSEFTLEPRHRADQINSTIANGILRKSGHYNDRLILIVNSTLLGLST